VRASRTPSGCRSAGPRPALIRQYAALLATEGVTLTVSTDGIDAIARIAAEVNETVENIGARRLHTVLEKLLETISFDADERKGETVTVDAGMVTSELAAIAGNTDLSKYIL
jgi:ATP-dependent HslUV protease ATP-binding subunit HslU